MEEGRAHERFAPGDDDEGDAKVMCLVDDGAEFMIGEFLFDGGSDGFFVASFAVEVALVGDTEDHDWGDMGALVFPFLSGFGCFFLPTVGFDKVECLCGVGEADFYGVLEKDFEGIVKNEAEAGVFCGSHGESSLFGSRGGTFIAVS